MLEGKNVNLRVMDKEDFDFCWESWNNIDWYGEYESVGPQLSKTEFEKRLEPTSPLSTISERKRFIVETKDGTKIGGINHFLVQPYGVMEIGYALVPSERGKGYGTEAVKIILDYLFVTKNICRVQATTDVRNRASQRVLEKNGFTHEGVLRKLGFARGEFADKYIYSILREEWKESRIQAENRIIPR